MVVGSSSSRNLLNIGRNVSSRPLPSCEVIASRIKSLRSLRRKLSNNATDDRTDDDAGTSSQAWHLPPPPAPSASASDPLQRLKHPARGGQDLAHRYVRLERSLREKEEYEHEIADLEKQSAEASGSSHVREEGRGSSVTGVGLAATKRKGKKSLVFEGFTIPEAPKPPGPDECCMSGCAICVHDLYAEAFDAHEHALHSIRYALHDKGIAEASWPKQLREGSLAAEAESMGPGEGAKADLTGRDVMKAKQASLSAFEQMELQLAAKHAQEESRSQCLDQSGGSTGG